MCGHVYGGAAPGGGFPSWMVPAVKGLVTCSRVCRRLCPSGSGMFEGGSVCGLDWFRRSVQGGSGWENRHVNSERTLTDAVVRLAGLQSTVPDPVWSSAVRDLHAEKLLHAQRLVDALKASRENTELYEAGIRASQVRVREDTAQVASAQDRADRIEAIERELATIERLRIQLLLERARLQAGE